MFSYLELTFHMKHWNQDKLYLHIIIEVNTIFRWDSMMIISYIPIDKNNSLKMFSEFNTYTYYIIKGIPEIIQSNIIATLAEKFFTMGESTELMLSPYNNLPSMLIFHKNKTVIICGVSLPQQLNAESENIICNIKNEAIDRVVSEEIIINNLYINSLKVKIDNYIKTLSIVEQESEALMHKLIKHQKVNRFITRMIPSGLHSENPHQRIRYGNLFLSNSIVTNDTHNIYIQDKFGAISSEIIKKASIKLNREKCAYILFQSQAYHHKYDGILIPEININIIATTKQINLCDINCNRFIDLESIRYKQDEIHMLCELQNDLTGECKRAIKTIQKLNKINAGYYDNHDAFILAATEKIEKAIKYAKCFT